MSLKRHLGGYALVGALQWLLEYAVMLALSQWVMPVEPANVIGRLCGAVLGFWLNGKWTFAGDDTHVGRRALRRFVLMWIGLTVLNTWAVHAIDAHFGLRMQKATQQLGNTNTLRTTRRDIARAKTILAEKQAAK